MRVKIKPFIIDFGNLTLEFSSKLCKVVCYTNCYQISDFKKSIALQEVKDMKEEFDTFKISHENMVLLKDRKIEFELRFQYGANEIIICKEISGKLIWERTIEK